MASFSVCDSKKRKVRDVDASRFFFNNKNFKHGTIQQTTKDYSVMFLLRMNWTCIDSPYRISTEHLFKADEKNTPKNVLKHFVMSLESNNSAFTGRYYDILDKLCMGNERIEMHMFLESNLESKNRVFGASTVPQRGLIQVESEREVTFSYIHSKFLI
jgi:hypothetical protein